MNKTLLAGSIAIVVLLIALGAIAIREMIKNTPPEEKFLADQVEELKGENAELESQKAKDIVEIRDLNARVESLSASRPGGMEIEEKRKALAIRESELDRREKRLVRREEQLRLDRTKLDNEERDFYDERGHKVEEIGEAKQIKENHERMLARLGQAEERANNWLKAISAISILFFVGIIAFVAFLMYMAAKNKKIDMAMRTVESVSLSAHDRNLLMASLGGRIIDQSRDNDDEH